MTYLALPRILIRPNNLVANSAAVAAAAVALWALSGVLTVGLIGGIAAVATSGFVSSIRTHRQNKDEQLTHWVGSVRRRMSDGEALDTALVKAATHCRVDAVQRLAAGITAGIGTKKAIREFDRKAESSATDDLVSQILTTGTADDPAVWKYDDIPMQRYNAAQTGALIAGISAVMMIVFSFILGQSGQIGGHLPAELTLGGIAMLWGVFVYGMWHTSRPEFRYPISEYWCEE